MTTRGLREPDPATTAAATPDPAVELAREHQAAINRLNTPGEISDDDTGEFLTNVVVPLEEKLARTRPTSREGIMALLDVAAGQAHRESDETPNSGEAMIIGVMQNARDAIKAGVGTVGEAGDEPLVALYAKWRALEWRKPPEGLTEDEAESFTDRTADEADAVSVEIIAAPAKTLIGAYAHIALLKFWAENGIPDRLEAALARFYGHVEAALQGAGRTGGGEDPVVQIVQTLPAMFDKLTRLEIKEVKQGEALRWSGTYYDLIRATEGVIAQTPATSLEGALAQIAIANACVHEIEDSVEDNLRHDRAVDARSLLYSAVLAIEAATGARRPEVTASRHMIDAHNPLMGAAS